MLHNEQKYSKTIATIQHNLAPIIEEVIFLQHIQTALLRNDSYLIKDKDTQAVFENILCKNQSKKTPNNHQKAFDIKHFGNQISIKSGIVSNNVLKFSYSRTTEHATLEDKIDYLSTFENLILGIASEKMKSSSSNILTQTRYHLYYFPANEINLRDMVWSETANQFTGLDQKTGTLVEIKRKMSDQPWIALPLDNIVNIPLIESSVISHKNRKYLIIDNLQSSERIYYDIYAQRKKIKAIKGLEKCSISTIKAPIL